MQNHLLSARSQVFHNADPHTVSEYVNQHVGSHSIRLPTRGPLEASLDNRKFGTLDICQISYGGSVQVTTTSLDTIYHLQILLSGYCHWTGREGKHLFVPGELMIINPDEPVVLTYSNDWLSLKHCSDDSQSLTGREAHELPRRRRYSAALALPTCCSAWQGRRWRLCGLSERVNCHPGRVSVLPCCKRCARAQPD